MVPSCEVKQFKQIRADILGAVANHEGASDPLASTRSGSRLLVGAMTSCCLSLLLLLFICPSLVIIVLFFSLNNFLLIWNSFIVGHGVAWRGRFAQAAP